MILSSVFTLQRQDDIFKAEFEICQICRAEISNSAQIRKVIFKIKRVVWGTTESKMTNALSVLEKT